MIIKKVEVETTTKYVNEQGKEDARGVQQHCLVLRLPLPGGKAIYEIPVSSDMKKNLEIAAQLTT